MIDDLGCFVDFGMSQFLQICKWFELNDVVLLMVVFDECKVVIDYYVDNVDDV